MRAEDASWDPDLELWKFAMARENMGMAAEDCRLIECTFKAVPHVPYEPTMMGFFEDSQWRQDALAILKNERLFLESRRAKPPTPGPQSRGKKRERSIINIF